MERCRNVIWFEFEKRFVLNFKVNYELDGGEMEIIDIYQVICFLLRIPLGTHDGEWDRIKGKDCLTTWMEHFF